MNTIGRFVDTSDIERGLDGRAKSLKVERRDSWQASRERAGAVVTDGRAAASREQYFLRDNQRRLVTPAGDTIALGFRSPGQRHTTKPRVQPELKQDAERISAHESGHALLAFSAGRKMHCLTIEADGGSVGTLDLERQADVHDLRMLLAGREGERVLLGEAIESGCLNDDEQALICARVIAAKTGADVEVLITKARDHAARMLTCYREALADVASKLRRARTLRGDEIDTVIARAVDAVHERDDAEKRRREGGGA